MSSMNIYRKNEDHKDPDALELDPEAPEDCEDLDENELVTTSGDGYYILGNKKNRNFW